MSFPEVKMSEVAPIIPLESGLIDREGYWLLNLDQVEANSGRILSKLRVDLNGIGTSTNVFGPQHVLYSKLRPNLNKVVVPDEYGYCSSELVPLLPDKERLDRDYLAFYLRSPDFVNWAVSKTAGAKMPRLSMKLFGEQKIPLPPLPTQRRIAKVLKQVDRLRQQAQQIETELKQLTQSLFLDLFGDYRQQTAEKFVSLAEVADVVSGVAKGSKLSGAVRTLPYLRVANVQDGFLNLSDVKEIEATERDIKKYMLKPGDILMTEGGDFDKLGRGAMWSGEITECIHQNHIFRVRLSDDYDPQFFECYLRTQMVKTYFLSCAKKTTNLASINMTQLKALPMPKEPRDRQTQFAVTLQRIEAQRQVTLRQQAELEQAFQSLMQRAFRGELALKLA